MARYPDDDPKGSGVPSGFKDPAVSTMDLGPGTLHIGDQTYQCTGGQFSYHTDAEEDAAMADNPDDGAPRETKRTIWMLSPGVEYQLPGPVATFVANEDGTIDFRGPTRQPNANTYSIGVETPAWEPHGELGDMFDAVHANTEAWPDGANDSELRGVHKGQTYAAQTNRENYRFLEENEYRLLREDLDRSPYEQLRTLLQLMVGAASMTWPEVRGIFDTEKAGTIVDESLSYAYDVILPRYLEEWRKRQDEKAAKLADDKVIGKSVPGAMSFSFDVADVHPEAMRAMYGLPRYGVELVPSKFDVVVNGIKTGYIYRSDRGGARWMMGGGTRVAQSVREAVLTIVRAHAPAHTDRPSERDLGIVQVQVETTAPSTSDEDDEGITLDEI